MRKESTPENRVGVGRKSLPYFIAGSSILSACSLDPSSIPENSADVVPFGQTVVCPVEYPNCDESTALFVFNEGNHIPARTSPRVCEDGKFVHEDLDTDIHPDVIWAYIAREDGRICEDGLDIRAVIRAAVRTLSGNRQGASNTAMQTGRNLDVENVPENDLLRKWWEFFRIGPALEAKYTQTELVNLYMNIVYFGRGAYGITAASYAYFDKPASDLELHEAAFLVGLLKNPGRYEGSDEDPSLDAKSREDGIARRNNVLDKMVEFGRITKEDADNIYKKRDIGTLPYNHFGDLDDSVMVRANNLGVRFAIDAILEEAVEITGASRENITRDFIINTTISINDQAALWSAIQSHQPQNGAQYGGIIYDDTGGVSAYVPGIYSENGPNINLMTEPIIGGSGDKPYFVATALENGINPEDFVIDPDGYDWLDYDAAGRDYFTDGGARCPNPNGIAKPCTFAQSIAYSSNGGLLSIAETFEDEDVSFLQDTFTMMDDFGMTSESNVGPAAILGGREMAPNQRGLGFLQLIARQGIAVEEERMINSIVLPTGETVAYQAPEQYRRVVDPVIAAELTRILYGVSEFGTASNAFSDFQLPIPIKTGTAEGDSTANISWAFCDASGRNKAGHIIARFPRGVGGELELGFSSGTVALVGADVTRALTGEPCDVIAAAPKLVTAPIQ